MLAIFNNVLFPGHKHLLTISTDDLRLELLPERLREVADMVVKWWIVAFWHSVCTQNPIQNNITWELAMMLELMCTYLWG